jgi:hypothetical protein
MLGMSRPATAVAILIGVATILLAALFFAAGGDSEVGGWAMLGFLIVLVGGAIAVGIVKVVDSAVRAIHGRRRQSPAEKRPASPR